MISMLSKLAMRCGLGVFSSRMPNKGFVPIVMVMCYRMLSSTPWQGQSTDGDLGTHYPENDPNAENARSLEFVAEFAGYMRSRGYELINLDSFITLGTTRLRPYLAAIRANVAAALKISEDVVSVKGRSHDGIGEVGRGEACSATVSVLLRQEKSI